MLERRDILALEPQFSEFLARVLPFSAHGLYFPQDAVPTEPVWIAREHKLLLPLVHRDRVLGVFIASGVKTADAKKVLPLLPQVVSLCLDAVELYKQSRTDALTGLALREELLTRMAQDADHVRTRLSRAPDDEDEGSAPLHRACMGLVLVRVDNLDQVARSHGYGLADALILALAKAVQATAPHEVLCARTGDDEFTLLVPAATRGACQKLAEALLHPLDAVHLVNPLTGLRFGARLSVGHALYPQDMAGLQFKLSMGEQSRILLHKARLAAAVARQKMAVTGSNGGVDVRSLRVMAFSRILVEGGVILETQPLGRVRISLGRHAGAREGLRFSVWTVNYPVRSENRPDSPLGLANDFRNDAEARAPLYKGEVVLVDVQEAASVAEILHVGDPAWPLEPGDTLALLTEEQALQLRQPEQNSTDGLAVPVDGSAAFGLESPEGSTLAVRMDSVTGLLRHGDFLQCFGRERERYGQFSLALVRVNPPSTSAEIPAAAPFAEHIMGEMADVCRRHLTSCALAWLGGRFGGNSLVFLHPQSSADTLLPVYQELCRALSQRGMEPAAGLAEYPFLHFRKGEMLECCQKALDFALLLPQDRVGAFGSLALNISADKSYSQGDVFAAVEEYKLALLADSGNAMAWNSLGVCMAALSRHNEARRYFTEALKRAHADKPGNDDAAVLYNLGVVCQNLGEKRSAARHFRACVKADPEHIFAHIRLGQMAEHSGKLKDARFFHTRAAALEDAMGAGGSGLALRHLARVALRQRKPDEARELLHEALVRNPQDPLAMQMLASLYLDGGEDPGMAEMLARKSVGLHPDNKKSWLLLARALHALGREADARGAEGCAEKL